MSKKLLSIVIPAYNEEEVIPELALRLNKLSNKITKYNFEIIIVENGSTDGTFEKLLQIHKKYPQFKILQLAKNAGCDGGIIAGLSYASGDAAIIMMADLQDIPELIPQFITKWENGFDIVYAIVEKRKNLPVFKIIGAFIFYRLINMLTKGAIPENVSDFRLIDRKVYTVITQIPEHNKFFRGIAGTLGFKQIGISFERPERTAGYSKADIITSLRVAGNAIISFSYFPLRISWMFSVMMLVASIASFILLHWILASILICFSAVGVILGIQGEYMMRVIDEVRNRPNFVVQDVYGLSKEK